MGINGSISGCRDITSASEDSVLKPHRFTIYMHVLNEPTKGMSANTNHDTTQAGKFRYEKDTRR